MSKRKTTHVAYGKCPISFDKHCTEQKSDTNQSYNDTRGVTSYKERNNDI